MNDIEQLKKTYQKILFQLQNEVYDLQRNCDFFNEQMNNAVARTVELNERLNKIKNCCEQNINLWKNDYSMVEIWQDILQIIEGD